MATLIVYPDPSSGATTVDGHVSRGGADPFESFATIRAGAGNGSSATGASINLYLNSGFTADFYATMRRGILTFDTSALGATAIISSAVLSLVGFKDNGLGDTDLYVVASTPAANNVLADADYTQLGSTSFGTVAYGSFNGDGATHNAITLNASGIAAISKTGITKLGLRNGYDYLNIAPIWVQLVTSGYSILPADTAGTASDPKLTITYTVPTEPDEIIDATNATPIEIKTAAAHGLKPGVWRIVNVTGNTAANGTRAITFTQITISSASGTTITTSSPHGWSTGQVVVINGVRGVNGARTITVTGASTFTTSETATAAADSDAYVYAGDKFLLTGSAGSGAFAGGGLVTTPLNFQVLEGWVRRRTHTVTEDRLTTPMFVDWTNWTIAELVPKVYQNNDYITTSSLGAGTSFSLSALKLRRIEKVVDATNGLIVPIGSTGFERIQNLSSLYTNSAFWTQQGETLKVFYGSGLTGGTVTLYYHKVPDLVVEVEDGFDIDDTYFALILDKVANQVEDWKRFNNWKPS